MLIELGVKYTAVTINPCAIAGSSDLLAEMGGHMGEKDAKDLKGKSIFQWTFAL